MACSDNSLDRAKGNSVLLPSTSITSGLLNNTTSECGLVALFSTKDGSFSTDGRGVVGVSSSPTLASQKLVDMLLSLV